MVASTSLLHVLDPDGKDDDGGCGKKSPQKEGGFANTKPSARTGAGLLASA